MFRLRALMKVKCLSFLFQQKRNSKIGACEHLALSTFYSTKRKNHPFFIELLFKNLCPPKGYTRKVDFEKNKKQSFSMQYIFIRNRSAYLPNIFALFLRLYYVDIWCLNCDRDSSYVDVASCRICFINLRSVLEIKLHL